MPNLLQAFWNEPRAPNAPGPFWRDWVLVIVFVLAATVEGVIEEDKIWRSFSTVLTVALALTLPWRRTYPLSMATIAFGASAVVQTVALVRGVEWSGLNSPVFLLILPYALLRWGSGREAILGVPLIAVSIVPAMLVGRHSWTEVLGASLFLLFPAALGASVRYQDGAQRRAHEQVRLQEREQLARELHDTVAHHVSAIAIQAQAGQAAAANRPEAPIEILGIIEEAASRTLSEMRHIVQALREEGEPVRAPAATLADIRRLARDDACPLQVKVAFSGELDELDNTLESTLYRLAQEAVTNAVRHARGAQSVTVQVTGEMEQVRLSVIDDGNLVTHPPVKGLGLRGMTERVVLLGGTLQVNPGSTRGWIVEAILPKRGTR